MYISSARIPIAKLKKFIKGSGITLSPGDASDATAKQVRIVFGKLKDQRRMLRNFSFGKGFVLKHAHVNDIEDEEEGGSIFDKFVDKIKEIGKKAGAPYEKTVGVNPFTTGYKFGHDVIAPPLIKALGRKPAGGAIRARKSVSSHAVGGKLTAKKVGNKIKDAFEKVGKVLAKEGKTIAKRNKGELGALARGMVDVAVAKASGDVTDGQFKDALKSTAQQTAHMVARDVGTTRGVFTKDNPYQYGQYKPVSVPVAEVVGDAEVGGALGLGGDRLLRNPMVNPMSASERMAHARSFRKNGGSMKPLGGSIRPL